jgi:hypothetical protein
MLSSLNLQPAEYSKLENAVETAISATFSNISKPEPQLIANLAWEFPSAINNLGLKNISAGGVFCHQRPHVMYKPFPDPRHKSVEVGDILIIRKLVKRKEIVDTRALLFQAKKIYKLDTQPDNLNQWRLYADWPVFTYTCPKTLAGKKRHIREPDMYDAAKYLLIVDGQSACEEFAYCHLKHSEHCCNILTAQPRQPQIGGYQCFIHEILEFIYGNAGKPFETPDPGTRGWNQFIFDQIAATAELTSTYIKTASSGKAIKRGTGDLFYCLRGFTSAQSIFRPAVLKDLTNKNDFKDSEIPPRGIDSWPSGPDGDGMALVEIVIENN